MNKNKKTNTKETDHKESRVKNSNLKTTVTGFDPDDRKSNKPL